MPGPEQGEVSETREELRKSLIRAAISAAKQGTSCPSLFDSADSDSDQAFSKLLPGLKNLTLFWAWQNSQSVFIFHSGVTSLTVHLSYPYYDSGVQLLGHFPNVREWTINRFPPVRSNAILVEGWDDDDE
ncbi:hypothetical protein FA15DRAFT_702447 [Coprinopsis marcescibilis]|uniref:Uncharacterized protein n=1 Tax=Coprinopsis marcescibilis TaxID=230819 RepID=A0A5C3L1M3_COPMA|nr:hypothetical protein FA15DRAFT_702447 [Coprinopsis marcescibilis]